MQDTRSSTSYRSTISSDARAPARHPDRLQLYSLPTPNGVKVSIMLEEIGLAYEAHLAQHQRQRIGDRYGRTDHSGDDGFRAQAHRP